MPIRVKYFATLRKAAGVDGDKIEARTVGDLIKKLRQLYRDNSAFVRQLKYANAILNGNNVTFLQGSRTPLKDGDELLFFPPLGGG